MRIRLRDREFGYVDFGGTGPVLLALHGSFGRGAIFAGLAASLTGVAGVLAPDQRGHGDSEHGGSFGQDEFVADAAEFVRALGIGPCAVLGHSHGGVTAYTLAARHPELVSALLVEDACADVPPRVLDVSDWPVWLPSPAAWRAELAGRGIPDAGYFLHSAVSGVHGVRLAFDYADMMATQRGGHGNRWADWLGSSCPALLVHGLDSGLLPTAHAREMARRRPGTELVEVAGAGHWVHDDRPAEFGAAVRDFLASRT